MAFVRDPSPIPGLAEELARAVRGSVRFDTATRAMWSADASNYRRVPIGVVTPRDAEDVEAAIAVCRAHEVPLLPVGARTSIAGQAVNTAVVLDFSRMSSIVAIDPEARTARVQPGVVLDALRDAARPHGLTFGPDPSTHNRCTLGGMIGNNACGSHSVAWGKTVDNVHTLDVLTYRGDRMTVGPGAGPDALRELASRVGPAVRTSFPELTRRVSGYNLDQLLPEHGFDVARALVGTEGTCVTTLEATVRLVEAPAVRALAILGFPDAYTAADHVMPIRALGPLTIEGMDAGLIAALRASQPNEVASRMLPEGGGWLYVETGGATRAEAEAAAQAVVAAVPGASSLVVGDPAAQRALWRIREDGAGIVTRSPDGDEAWPGWEDAAVPPERFGAYLREFDALLRGHRRRGAYYGHFGDGCLHIRIDFDLLTAAGVADFRSFMEDAADLAVAHGGSLSGEHGDGVARAELLPRMYPPEIIDAFAAFKGVWDPDDKMNPGRVVRPARTGRGPAGVRRAAHLARTAGARVHRGPRLVHPGHPPVPRGRAVRYGVRRRDVPQLPRDGGGAALHARARTAAVRDGQRAGDRGRVACAGGGGGARPVPVVQGLQARLPGRRGHGRLQDRVPGAALPVAAAARVALQHGRAAVLAVAGGVAAAAGDRRAQRRGARPARGAGETAGRRGAGARDPPARPRPGARSRW